MRRLWGAVTLLAFVSSHAAAAPAAKPDAKADAPVGKEAPANDEQTPFDRDIGLGVEAEELKVGPGDITGRLEDQQDGKKAAIPLPNITVTLVNAVDGLRLVETKTNEKGEFNLGRQQKGQYLITLGRGYLQGKILVTDDEKKNERFVVNAREDVVMGSNPAELTAKGGVKDVNTYTTGVGEFRGRLMNENGDKAVPDMPIRLLSREDGSTLVRTETDKDGYFNLGNVEEGSYVMAVGQATLFCFTSHSKDLATGFLQINSNLDLLRAGYVGTIFFSEQAAVFIPIIPPAAFPVGTALIGAAVATGTGLGVGIPVATNNPNNPDNPPKFSGGKPI